MASSTSKTSVQTLAAPAVAAAPAASQTLDRALFGKRLRAARKQFGWTLSQVSDLSGVSITTISRAERGQLALSYEKFSALGTALRMDMGTMFAGAGVQATAFDGPVVTRAGEGVVYRGLSFSYEFLGTTARGKKMSPILGTVHARRIDSAEDFVRHPGEEFVYVLSGSLEVHFVTGRCEVLRRGDALYFDSSIGHAYISTSKQLARVLGVTLGETDMMKMAREGDDILQAESERAKKKTPHA